MVAESVEDIYPSFRCMVLCNGPWTETMRLTLNGKEWHSSSTSTRSNVGEVSP